MSFFAYAGPFACTAYGSLGCSKHIEDLVTDKFTAKFPIEKFTIVTVYEFQTHSDGGGVGYAIAGVVPKISDPEKYGNLGLFPTRRFATTRRVTGNEVKPGQKTQHELEIMRRAVELMMAACDREPDCNIMETR